MWDGVVRSPPVYGVVGQSRGMGYGDPDTGDLLQIIMYCEAKQNNILLT